MIYINGTLFYEKPTSCGTCPFWHSDGTFLSPSCNGFCLPWGENHKSYIAPPRRCQKLFNKAFRFPEGTELCIVGEKNSEKSSSF